MDEYMIKYSKGGRSEIEKADTHLEAITKNAAKSVSNVRFFETYPALEPNHFMVVNTRTHATKFYKMVQSRGGV